MRQKEAAAKRFGAGRRRVCGRTKRSTVLSRPPIIRKGQSKNRDCKTQCENGKRGGPPQRCLAPNLLEGDFSTRRRHNGRVLGAHRATRFWTESEPAALTCPHPPLEESRCEDFRRKRRAFPAKKRRFQPTNAPPFGGARLQRPSASPSAQFCCASAMYASSRPSLIASRAPDMRS